jgi:hypothetical protein
MTEDARVKYKNITTKLKKKLFTKVIKKAKQRGLGLKDRESN